MFGFSLAKLVVAAILIFGVWYGFKMMNSIAEARSDSLPGQGKGKVSPHANVEDLTECGR